MRFITICSFLLLLLSLSVKAQCPPNIGFEKGSYVGWQCYSGTVSQDTRQLNIAVSPTAPTPDRHTIIDKTSTQLDPYGLFPVVCPNGSQHSVKLGNEIPSRKADRITYTYTIPPGSSYTLLFYYAVVLQNPSNHGDLEQPRFTAKVYDVTDSTYVNCPSFNFSQSSSIPGFKLSSTSSAGQTNSSVYYKDWSATTINLVGYAGKTIQLEFTVNDCTRGQHFGYAYLDLDENCGSAITGNTYCLGQSAVTLRAPAGFSNYTWYNGNKSKQLGQGQTLTLSPPPPDLSTYAVKIDPFAGVGCQDTLYTTVHRITTTFKLNVPEKIYGCPGSAVDLTAPEVTAGSSLGTIFSYYNDFNETSFLYRPNEITTPGTYYIKGQNTEGCESIMPIQVVIDTPQIKVNNDNSTTYPNTIDLSRTYTHRAGYTYTYYSDATASKAVENYWSINKSGTYYIKATTGNNCYIIAPVNVTINPPPPYIIKAPNTFTPNGDGRNERFSLNFEGYVTFGNLRIYNREGQLVFSSRTIADYWDGTYAGKELPVGVYYWVFDGYDSYSKAPIKRTDYITLLR
ncbi:gliding motility-associated C-terminal domain-containing protein [Mucilaginibacter robiniae]|uniref:Gliding motility-associated C-terminal domain-containing protein n=1 Tax=Mucilaginibacter robiniae TaxID=2728022 RepID=A0A7L5E3T4_9SPHI|nr:gliding motility-associated C-terminal domain-containing protein [Mucilaginibacter robiniae]QJD97992.1 gliding motility-associated C-terminal domain-containing protein [Mucilaginibacter robiniae]